jgi:hypothetical protein
MKRRTLLVLGMYGLAASAWRSLASPASSTSVPPGERLLVRRADGSLSALDSTTGRVAYSLPAGLASDDSFSWRWVVLRPANAQTSIDVFDPRDASSAAQLAVEGRYDDAALSHDGKLLLLVGTSGLGVVDLDSGDLRHAQHLEGRFSADTLDERGAHVYLVQHQPEKKPNAYRVVHYDPDRRQVTGEVADKTGAEVMAGYRLQQVWSPIGEWLYSLYLNPAEGSAFIHALNVPGNWAACLDLPGEGQSEKGLRACRLALAPATRRVFAVNPAVGTVSTFRVGEIQLKSYALPAGVGGGLAISPDGTTIYLAGEDGVLALPANQPGQAGSRLLAGTPIRGVGLGSAGRTLYALSPDRLTGLHLQTGSTTTARVDLEEGVAIERVVPWG